MNGKKFIALTMVMIATVIGLAAFLARGADGLTVTAGIGSDCQSQPKTFTVPDGKTAVGFALVKLEPGSACHGESAPPENKGYSVRDGKGRPVYTWSQFQTQAPYEKGGPLANLSLIPGNYTLSVAGGAGAKVELSYRLK